ncbi:PLP-dependent transferase [Mucidula mucida]|nr:PLP-dependent transferase [Mucidula mucida]
MWSLSLGRHLGALVMGNSTSQMNQPYNSSPPPPFGHAILPFFLFDPNYVNLNHGSYGSCPRPVRDACIELGDQIESCPDLWLRLKYQPKLVAAREQLASLIGVKDVDEVVLVPNASHGINTVMRNFIWNEGDVIVICNTTHAEVSAAWRKHLASVRASAGPNAKIVAVIDGLISNPGCLLPWEDMTAACREQDVYSIVDAAHVIGQQVDINLDEVKPDFWISNCHKWLFAKRSVAVMYVPKRNQHIVTSSIPTAHSYISPKDRKEGEYNFVDQYEWNGTIDWVPYLTVPDALAFRSWLGGEHKINDYCHKLAIEGGKKLVEIFGTRLMDPDGEFTAAMVNVQLPIPPNYAYAEMDMMFKEKLLVKRNMFGAQYYHNQLWWTRCSAQVFNDLSDFEKFGKALKEVCFEIVEELDKAKGMQQITKS